MRISALIILLVILCTIQYTHTSITNYSSPSTITIGVIVHMRTYYSISVSPNESIQHVKVLVRNVCGVAVEKQRLTYAGKDLVDGTTLADYNIHDGTAIRLMPRP